MRSKNGNKIEGHRNPKLIKLNMNKEKEKVKYIRAYHNDWLSVCNEIARSPLY